MTDDYLPCIEGGKFTDECFRAFFKALNLDIRFVWEKKSDMFCLTQRILRKEQDPDGLLYKKLLNKSTINRKRFYRISSLNRMSATEGAIGG